MKLAGCSDSIKTFLMSKDQGYFNVSYHDPFKIWEWWWKHVFVFLESTFAHFLVWRCQNQTGGRDGVVWCWTDCFFFIFLFFNVFWPLHVCLSERLSKWVWGVKRWTWGNDNDCDLMFFFFFFKDFIEVI